MTNEQKFKTPEERQKAFQKFCICEDNGGYCDRCKYWKEGGDRRTNKCIFLWLADEYKEPDLPFKVQPRFGGGDIVVETVKGSKVFDEMRELTARQVCDSINAAALAWHKCMVEKVDR